MICVSLPDQDTKAVIRTEKLTRAFGRFLAVQDVTFHVMAGEIFGFLGANGAGKSTTIRMLCGLLKPSSGLAWVSGINVIARPEAVKQSLGYMSQRFSLYLDLRVEENLEFFGGAYGLFGPTLRQRIHDVLDRVDLTEHRQIRTGDLSSGTRQRLALASALLHRPAILFLDEPTAGVDPGARRAFWQLIRDLSASGTTVFVTTHYMDEAEYCHRIGLMTDGRLMALGTPQELKDHYVPGVLIKLEGSDAYRALDVVREIAGVVDTQPFGAAAHVRLNPQQIDVPQLTAALQQAGFPHLNLYPIEPTLEDVFLAVGTSARPTSTVES